VDDDDDDDDDSLVAVVSALLDSDDVPGAVVAGPLLSSATELEASIVVSPGRVDAAVTSALEVVDGDPELLVEASLENPNGLGSVHAVPNAAMITNAREDLRCTRCPSITG
jgi:hypothetical protein